MRILSLITALLCSATASLRADAPITKVTLERTPCFGTCPVYTVTVHRSGRVVFTGKDHVRAKGVRAGRVSAANFAALVRKIEEINFFGLRNRYDGRNPDGTGVTVTDLPTRKTSVTRGGQTKTVENYFRGPPALAELEELIDKMARTEKWIRG